MGRTVKTENKTCRRYDMDAKIHLSVRPIFDPGRRAILRASLRLVFPPGNDRQPARVTHPGNTCNAIAVGIDDALVVNSARLLMKTEHNTLTLGCCESTAPRRGAVEKTNGK